MSLFTLAELFQLSCPAQGCPEHVRLPDAGCCRPQRKSPGIEGSRGVERARADNGWPLTVGRTELKNKTSSFVSLMAKLPLKDLSSISAVTSFVTTKFKVLRFFLTYSCYALCHCLN